MRFHLVLAVLLAANVSRADHISHLQSAAVSEGKASWGYWGLFPEKYSSWNSHSNRLLPIYTFGVGLDQFKGVSSPYRDPAAIEKLYGKIPAGTLNPAAEYMDQTDVYRVQQLAIESGKKYVILFVFDGMDWNTTRAAAVYQSGKVYHEGRGAGLAFLDYRGAPTDFGYFVTSPHNDGTKSNVDSQTLDNPGGLTPGGYDFRQAGLTPWSAPANPPYMIGKSKHPLHAYVDSAASATALNSGVKTYNDSINVDVQGRQVEPIARTLQKQGYAIGVVTSVPISHATPACAYANNVHRNDYQDITRDLLGLASISHRTDKLPGADVVLGAGWGEMKEKDKAQGSNFVPGNKYLTDADLRRIDIANGGQYVTAVRTAGRPGPEVLAAGTQQAIETGSRLFGYFGTKYGHLPFRTADGDYEPTKCGVAQYNEEYDDADRLENPTLADMTSSALKVLSKRSDRFWLMVEAGDVDWGNHSNNIDHSIGATISGDNAFKAAVEWIEANDAWDDSAVIVTADHGHYLVLENPEALIPPDRRAKN